MKHDIIDVAVIEEYESIEELYIIPIETHIGAAEFNLDLFREWLSWVEGMPQARLLFPGDMLECATASSVGNKFTQTMSPDVQMEWAIDNLAPVAGKIYGVIEGNHEYRVTKETDIAPNKWVARELGIPYFREAQGVLKISLGKNGHGRRIAYIVHFLHGGSNAGTNGGALNAAERTGLIVANADVTIYGHTHKVVSSKTRHFVVDPYNNCIRQEKRYFALAGSLLGYADYAKRKACRPLPEGCPRIRLDGRKKDVHVTI